MHIRELEVEFEDKLFHNEDSSGLSGIKSLEVHSEEDKEIEEDSDNEENEEQINSLKVHKIIEDIKRKKELEKEKLVEKAHFSSEEIGFD